MAVLPCWADRCVQVALCSVPRDDPFGFCPVVVFVSMCRYVGIYYIYIVLMYFFIHTNTRHHLLRYHQNLRVRLEESFSQIEPIREWWMLLLLLLHVVDNTDSSGRSAAAAAAEDCRYKDAYYPLGVGSS